MDNTKAGSGLRPHVLSEEQQRELLPLIVDAPGNRADMWDDMLSLPAVQERLQFAEQVASVTGANIPLIKTILQDPSLSSAADLVKLDAASWADLVTAATDAEASIPAAVKGSSVAERIRTYASGVADAVQEAMPGPAVAHLLRTDPSVLTDGRAREGVLRFLANSTGFDPRATRISKYLAHNEEEAFAGIDPGLKPSVTAHLRRIQRALQLARGTQATAALLHRGLDSAHKIASIPRRSFLDQHSEALGGKGPAAHVYERALTVSGRSLLLYTGLNDAKNGITPRAIAGRHQATEMAQLEAGLIRQVPDYADLFDAMDLCQCEDCRSVLSPTAYLVDLLQFLANSTPNAAGVTPLDVLLTRRSDLATTELSCENANTALPYIDLVNEILEGWVVGNGQGPGATTLAAGVTAPATSISTAGPLAPGLTIKIGTGGATEFATTGTASGTGPYTILVTAAGSSGGLTKPHSAGDPVSVMAAANDTGDATSADLEANPQHTLDQAYVTLAGQWYPLPLPYNQPVTQARTYLQNLGTSRFEIISSFQPAASAATASAADAEYLGITREQFQLLTGQDFDPNAGFPAPPLYALYGYGAADAPSWTSDIGHVPTFLSRTGIAYTDLVQLVSTRLVNPRYPQGADGDLFAKIPLDYATLSSLAQQSFATSDPGITNALTAAGISLNELKDWGSRNYPAIGNLLVLDNPGGGCDLATTMLTHLGDTGADPVSTVSATELSTLQQLIRLRNCLGWSISDIDRIFSARGTSTVTPALITDLARIQQLMNRFPATGIQTLASLWAPLDPWGADSLYQQLFLSPATLPIDPAFQPGPDGSVLADPAQLISDHLPALLAAFSITATDLALIRADTGLDADTAPLSGAPAGLAATANVSALYRYAALARLLAVPVADLITLRTLAGPSLDPFSSPSATVAFADLVDTVRASGFSPVLLNYLFRHISEPPAGPAPQQVTLLTLASQLRQGLVAIAAQTAVAADPTGTLTQATLTQLISKDVADEAAALINGTAAYTTPLAALPPAIALRDASGQVIGLDPSAVPVKVASKISYDPGSGDPASAVLRFTGAMTADEQTALLDTVSDAGFQAAINDLAQQPLGFIAGALASILAPAQADSSLVTAMPSLDADLHPVLLDASGSALLDADGHLVSDPARPPVSTAMAAKRAFVLESALPYLGQQLSHVLAKQTAVDAFGLDPAAAATLLETTLAASADPAQPLVADILALGIPGITAEYTTAGGNASVRTNGSGGRQTGGGSSTVLTVPTLGSADPRIAPGTTIPPGTQSAQWQAWLLPHVSASYTFTIISPGTTQLWVGDDTTPDGLQLTQDPATGALVTAVAVPLTAGQLTPLRLTITGIPEQVQSDGGQAELSWQCPTIPKSVIPSANLMPTGIFDNFALAYTRLQKAALLVGTFALSSAEISYLTTHPAQFAALDLNALPLTRDPDSAGRIDQQATQILAWWQRLQAYVTLRNSLPGGQVSLTDVFAATSLADAQLLLAQATGWDSGLLSGLVAGFGLANGSANPLTSEIWPVTLHRCANVAARTGASAAQLFSWAAVPPWTDNVTEIGRLQAIAQDIKKAARSRYDPASWIAVAKPLSDAMRTAQRDALVSYIVQALGLTDANQLLEVFLIDAEMGSCMETSRISQAISSVQLFVQRCLMNLETQVSPSAIDATAWREWKSQYATWGAARQMLLYPETYLLPSLRDDITPFFADIQSAILQNQITADNIEASFLAYLQDLEQVARLDIRGVYWQDTDPDTGEQVDTLHVLGRTFHDPRHYFYRRLLNATTTPRWTPWEQVPIDIQGDHLIPVIWNRRLRLIWPVFTEQSLPQAGDKSTDPAATISYTGSGGSGGTASSQPPPQKYWKVTLAWSEYVQGTWQPKKVSEDFLASLFYQQQNAGAQVFAQEPAQSDHVFKARVDGTDLVVDMLLADASPNPHLVGQFRFAAFGAAVTVEYSGQNSLWAPGVPNSPHQKLGDPLPPSGQMIVPANTGVCNNGIDQLAVQGTSETLDLPQWSSDPSSGSPGGYSRFLSATPTPFDLRFPQQYWQLQPGPFFYQDRDRTFFAMGAQYRFLGYWAQFSTHCHPFVPELVKALDRQQGPAQTGGVSGLLNTANQALGSPYSGQPWTRAETLPDPVAGPAAMIQGDYTAGPGGAGTVFDFEAVVLESTTTAGVYSLVHYYRSNSQPTPSWLRANVISATATGPATLIKTSYPSTNGHLRLDVIVPETGGVLAHYVGLAASAAGGRPVSWTRQAETLPAGVIGPSSLIQSSTQNPDGNGRLELVVLQDTNLVDCWWDGTTWQQGETITTRAALPGALVQASNVNVLLLSGQVMMNVVVPESPAAGTGPPWDLRHYFTRIFDGSWQAGSVISTAATGPACLIQSDIQDGWWPNLELTVPEGSGPPWDLVHYWLDSSSTAGDASGARWYASQVVSTQAADSGCLIQSSYGQDASAVNGDFEVLVAEGNSLVHYTHRNSDHVPWASLYQPGTYQGSANGPDVGTVQPPYPTENIDFTAAGAYSVYNWELFFHAPILIATTLSQNQQFADADAWFRFIFDPTADSPSELTPQRYWQVLPFKTTPIESITDLMIKLDQDDASAAAQVSDWQANPFAPFRIARLRLSAFQRWVFMKYLDNLIAWGDQLYAQNTRESINQAAQLYVLAADLLGPLPDTVPARTAAPVQTYAQLQSRLDAFSNVMELLENEFPFATQVPPPDPNADTAGLLGLSQTLFFGIPQNAAMLGYWTTVADRLSKIRNCMNLQGVVEQLPLFEPIANPALLAQAAAAGVDLGSVLSDVNTPPPNYRFSYLLSKALELCADCRAYGAALLAALEKADAEDLALLRATQETQVLNAMEAAKQDHISELTNAVSSLTTSRDVAWGRYSYYQTLTVGTTPSTEPAIGTAIQPGTFVIDNSGSYPVQLLGEESDELYHSHQARDYQRQAATYETLASICHYIPQGSISVEPFGVGAVIEYGGEHVGPALAAIGRWYEKLGANETYESVHSGKMAGYRRRALDWIQQSNLASGEMMRLDSEIAAANLRVTIANEELTVHQAQMKNAQKIQDTLASKYTSKELYQWMAGQASGLYFQLYQMAYSAAKQAEQAFDSELGLTATSYIQFGYWDSLRKGLTSGERLLAGLRQLDQAYITQNKREYEITRNISLLLHAPLALIALKETGRCIVEFPEALFDMDYPGHYMRRLKSVTLTVPCVVGPYTSVNCTLTLLAHKVRTSPDLLNQAYQEILNNDPRFQYTLAATQSIATSHGQNDGGLFELNFRDERYLPFETSGAVSRWLISMPPQCNAFDFSTITDVVFRLNYTAREGGDLLRKTAFAAAQLPSSPQQTAPGQVGSPPAQQNLGRLFSAKHEFPTDWYGLLHPADSSATYAQMPMLLSMDRFPFQYTGRTITVTGFDLYLTFQAGSEPSISQFDLYLTAPTGPPPPPGTAATPPMPDPQADKVTLTQDPLLGNVLHGPKKSSGSTTTAPNYWWLSANATGATDSIASILNQIDDIIVICHYSVK